MVSLDDIRLKFGLAVLAILVVVFVVLAVYWVLAKASRPALWPREEKRRQSLVPGRARIESMVDVTPGFWRVHLRFAPTSASTLVQAPGWVVTAIVDLPGAVADAMRPGESIAVRTDPGNTLDFCLDYDALGIDSVTQRLYFLEHGTPKWTYA